MFDLMMGLPGALGFLGFPAGCGTPPVHIYYITSCTRRNFSLDQEFIV